MGCHLLIIEADLQGGTPAQAQGTHLVGCDPVYCCDGLQWAQLPKDFPPFTTVQYHFYRMRDSGLRDAVNAVLVAWVRVAAGRKSEPSAGIIDSQSVKTTEAGGPRGYDAGKKIKGRKRHIVTDTLGNMLEGVVHGADVQDRDGAPGQIERPCDAYPSLTVLFADGGYAGHKLEAAVEHIDRLTIEIIRRSDRGGFVILPGAGLSNAPWRGSTGVIASPRTGKSLSHCPKRGWSSHPSGG